MKEARGITLWQPWASAVATGLKHFETRSWRTDYRGPLLIHASRRWTPEQASCLEHLRDGLLGILGPNDHRAEHLAGDHLGCIVAVADLVECWPTDDSRLCGLGMPGIDPAEALLGDWSPGRFAWQLENIIPLRVPVPCRGSQGLWAPEASVIDRVSDQLRGAAT